MEAGQAQLDEQHGEVLAQFILSHRSEILGLWERAVRRLPTARELPNPVLLDSVPELLVVIARAISSRAVAEAEIPQQVIEKHASQRLDTGFDLGQVVAEYSQLRDAILQLWDREIAPVDRGAARILHRAIDQSISLSVERFTQAQSRAARALDRIATANLESRDLDDLLRRLLAVLVDTMPAVDTAAILLREEKVLRVRAAVGLEREVEVGFCLEIGEGFAGTVAAEGRPLFIKSAAADPLVKSQILRERGIQALYGVPLIDGGTVIGVAHVGSLSASDFSDDDRRLVGSLAARATAAIYQQMLRANAEQRAAELRAVIESIPDAIYIADRKGITITNRPGLELLGLSGADEAAIGHVEMSRRIRAFDAATGEPVGEADGGFARAFKGQTTIRELKIVRPDGIERIVRTAVAPIPIDGRVEQAVAVTTDISESKRYEHDRAELLERERAARQRAEAAEAGQRFLSEATAILTSSLDYEKTLERITTLAVPQLADWCSIDLAGPDGKLRTLGIAHADPSKLAVAKQLAEKYAPRPDAPYGASEVVRTGRAEMSVEVSDDVLVAVAQDEEHLRILRELALTSYIAVPIAAHGRVFGALSLAVGRSSGRRYGPAELAVAEHLGGRAGLAIENARLYREAQESVRLREQVLAIVSHDLRNPVGASKLAADMVLRRAREQNDLRLVKQAETIHRAASRMEHLIGDLLDMASIHAGRLKIERRPQSAEALVREAAELDEPMAVEQGIGFSIEADVGDLHVDCDRDRILQVFSNLLGNAFKFCRRGDKVTVRARRAGSEIQFEVADTGPGIPTEERRHVFEPYWSAERQGKKGVGLGLFITRGVVEAHGGRIWVDSELDRGATFFFTLPIVHRT